jgi:peptidoglycan/LPS O-acetylase OafA/YrhL
LAQQKQQAGFRPEIEGIRALAALLVATFHIWLHRVSGGVDVFFVVSSFLITTGLLSQIERKGQVQFLAFWARLIKRLLPAALFVLVVVIIASVFLMPKSRWKDTIEQVAAAAIYLENWLLAWRSVDYLAQHEAVSPVQHFWALSVQGQFYFAWPILFALGTAMAQRLQLARRAVFTGLVLALFTASLAYSIWITAVNQPLAYFNTFARVWEFSIGALLALHLPRVQLPKALRVLMGWVGLLALLSCGLILQVSRVFPGYAALWPTLAAVLIITAGTTGSAFGADRLLSSRPLVYLGGISYAIYLWHFPLLTFARLLAAPGELSWLAGLGILLSSIVLAAITQRLIENPARYSGIGKEVPARALAFGAACLAPVVLGLGAWTALFVHEKSIALRHVEAGSTDYPGAMRARASDPKVYRGQIFPGPFAVADDREMLGARGCGQAVSATVAKPCVLGDPRGTTTIAVVGGSHSSQWLPAFQAIAREKSWRVVAFTKSNCPFYLGAGVRDNENAACSEWNRNVVVQLIQLRPDAVFTTSTRYADGDEFVPDGYLAAWRALAAARLTVIALRDNPDFEFDVSACVEIHGAGAPLCALPRTQMLETPSPVELLEPAPHNVKFIDLSDYFCDAQTCPPVIGNVLVYRHQNHITATYVRSLAPMLQRAIERVMIPQRRELTTSAFVHSTK